jgi:hypothetical protein
MPLKVKDADGTIQYLKTGAGDGSLGNPFEYSFLLDGGPVDTELPTAAALADATANPTAPLVGACMQILNPVSGNWYRWSSPAADGSATTSFGGVTNLLFNGATWDRRRGNLDLTLLASAARTATTASPDQTNHNNRGVQAILNVTANASAGGIKLTVQGKDPVSGNYYDLTAAPTAVTTTGTFVYELCLGVGAASGGVTQRTSGALPRTWRVLVTHADASSVTYSVGASLIV